ncbi:uncharacterized protein B0I36DRAFT_163633 [Microdochium trichocladiopsis]|uniref:N-acetyltransferase domain-containing protein n=1 Tax=Microdochium trichocladiopsis TaxID=1682393 RepID=A0A9P9BL87_9PEZI|nr:uncharacterized protein B0I36DRAFT_163633 [Microdochium trichocladiopsis]KAH7024672.1 hypothetical protein B0I36DRAFT_163633 [Microdochium trichocladiopsis]
MPLEVRPLELADFATLIGHADAGEPGDDLVAPPCPVSWPVKTREEAQLRARCHFTWQRQRFLEDPSVRYVKVVDTTGTSTTSTDPGAGNDDATAREEEESDEIVAVARWHFYPNGYDYEREKHWEMAPSKLSDSDAAAAACDYYPPPNFNVALHNHILGFRDVFRPQWIPSDKPAWVLMHCVTRPRHRRRGAAGMLVRWGQEQAREMPGGEGGGGVAAYLEAGVQGAPVYERSGFAGVGEARIVDLSGFEGAPVKEFRMRNMQWLP